MRLIIIIFLASSCKKDISVLTADPGLNNSQSNWDRVLKGLEGGNTLDESDLEYLQKRMVITDDNNQSRCDSVYLPTLLGSGGYLYFYPDYMKTDIGTHWFYYPPQNISAIIIFKVKWQQNGIKKSKTVYTLAKKLGDPYDIGSLQINDIILDYNTIFTAETWALSVCGSRYIFNRFGPYPNPFRVSNQDLKSNQNIAYGFNQPGSDLKSGMDNLENR